MAKTKSQMCPTLYTDILRACVNFRSNEYWLEVVDLCSRTIFRSCLGRCDSLRFCQLYYKLSYSLQRPMGEVPVVWHGFVLTSCNYASLVHVCDILEGALSHLSPDGDACAFARSIIELGLWDD